MKPWNDPTKTRAERRASLDALVLPKHLAQPAQDWQVYTVDVRFPDHPDKEWRRGKTWEVSAVSPEMAGKKAIAKSRLVYGLRTRLRGETKNAKRVKVKRFPGPRHSVLLPSPHSAQG